MAWQARVFPSLQSSWPAFGRHKANDERTVRESAPVSAPFPKQQRDGNLALNDRVGTVLLASVHAHVGGFPQSRWGHVHTALQGNWRGRCVVVGSGRDLATGRSLLLTGAVQIECAVNGLFGVGSGAAQHRMQAGGPAAGWHRQQQRRCLHGGGV